MVATILHQLLLYLNLQYWRCPFFIHSDRNSGRYKLASPTLEYHPNLLGTLILAAMPAKLT